jgi:hypothetical protein
MFVCKHCRKEFEGLSSSGKANHTKWCYENPKRSTYGKGCRQMNTEQSIAKRAASIKKAYADGKYDNVVRKGNVGYRHTEESKALISQKALASKHRRLVRSVREYVKRDGTVVMLDSSWEEALAKRLDEIGVNWIRPNMPIEYKTKDGKTHSYFPDFFLPDQDLYLDPKNPAALNAQKEKVEVLLLTIPNLLILKTLEECNKFQC